MEYSFQEDTDVSHKDIKIFFNQNQFPSFQYCGPNTQQHGIRGFSNHYHMQFDSKLGHVICDIRRITCACD